MKKNIYIKPQIKNVEYISTYVMIGIGDGTTSMVLGKRNNMEDFDETYYEQNSNWKNSIWDEK